MHDYTDLAGLAEVILEESYVLHLECTPGQVAFSLDVALTDKHPAYVPPGPESYLCYRKGVLVFGQVSELTWTQQGAPPATDATGEVDHGSIDSLQWDADTYHLEGDVGVLQINAGSVALALVPETA